MHVTFEVTGVRELRRDLDDLGVDFRKRAMRSAHGKAIRAWRKVIRALVPILTKNLWRAITTTIRVSRQANYSAIAITRGREAKNDAWYWFLVQFGTVKMKANPFVTRAFRRQEKAAGRTFVQVLNRWIGDWSAG